MIQPMPAVTFDTHKFVRRLKEAGVPEAQAEAISEAFKEAQGEADLATKQDLKQLEAILDKRLTVVETRLGVMEKLLWAVVLGVIALVVRAYLFPS